MQNEDIVPGLLAAIEDDFQKSFESDGTLKSLYAKIERGTATQADGEKFAHELGKLTSEVFHRTVTPEDLPNGKMYYNIAKRILPPSLRQNHGLVCEVMRQIMEAQNRAAGIGIRFQEPEFDEHKAHELAWIASSFDQYEEIRNTVETGLDTNTRMVADECVQENARFQYSAGLSPKIERKTDGHCCEWCEGLAGTYEYARAPEDVYVRHANCGCTVEFVPGNGKRQNVHTKGWTSETESAMMKAEGLPDDERSLEKTEKRKILSSVGMDYRPLLHFDPETREVGPNETIFVDRKLDAGAFQIYLSEKYAGKRRVAHEYEQFIKKSLKLLGPSTEQFPVPEFILASDTEIDNSYGRYSGEYNRVIYKPLPKLANHSEASNMHCVLHELIHWCDYQEALASGHSFSNDDEFIKYMSAKAKKKLDELGVNEGNVYQISYYAGDSYVGELKLGIGPKGPNYNETYVEYRVKKLLGE